MADATNNLSNMLVYVPDEYITSFKSEHIGDGKENDNYYNKISFLDNGQIASHGLTFGMDYDSISKIGLTSLPSTETSVVSYLVGLGTQVDNLSVSIDESMRAYVGQRISALVNNAPEALDTLGEIAAYLAADENLSSFAEMQAQIGQRAMVNGSDGEEPYAGNLYQYASYISNFQISQLDVADTAVANQYVSQVTETDGKISVTRVALPSYTDTSVDGQYITQVNQVGGQVVIGRASLPSYTDTAVAGKYVAAVNETNGLISVVRADLPSVAIDTTAGQAGQYISALSASGNTITATYTTLPSVTWTAQAGKYVSALTQSNGEITSVTFEALPQVSIANNSTNYLNINENTLSAYVTAISTNHDFVYTADPQQDQTTYSVKTLDSIGTGLATASNVINRIHSDEVYIASALSTLSDRIDDIVANSANGLDSEITIYDSGAYVSVHIVEEDGTLKASESTVSFSYEKIYAQLNSSTTATAEYGGVSYGSVTVAMANGKLSSSSLTINRDNLLAEAAYTSVSGTDADPFQVLVTEENHKVTGVTVQFNDLSTLWQVYSAS